MIRKRVDVRFNIQLLMHAALAVLAVSILGCSSTGSGDRQLDEYLTHPVSTGGLAATGPSGGDVISLNDGGTYLEGIRPGLGDPVENVSYEASDEVSDRSLTQAIEPFAEVIATARANHPDAMAANQQVAYAESQIAVAGRGVNPEFVLDVETPLHDQTDATEISTRLTVPLDQVHNRKRLIRLARSELRAAILARDEIHRRIASDALLAAIEVAYLQEKETLMKEDAKLAQQRLTFLSPELREGDAAENLIDFVDAQERAWEAKQTRIETRESLQLARITLAELMGLSLEDQPDVAQSLVLEKTLRAESLELPPLESVIAGQLADSSVLMASMARLQVGQTRYQNASQSMMPLEVGPLYQDRLGRDDDTIGVRFQTDLPLHDQNRSVARGEGIRARMAAGEVERARMAIAANTARDLAELRSIADQLRAENASTFLADQQRVLDDQRVEETLTGDQINRIRAAIVKRKLSRLELEYRFAKKRATLRLHAVVND